MPMAIPSRSRLRTPRITSVVTLDAATGAFDLRPLANYFGADSFEYSVSDGHGNTAQARVDVTVQPLPDPPVIDTSATASVIAAGRDAQLHFAIADPDGNAVTLSVSQVGGTQPLSNLQVIDQEVRFHAPDVSAATDVELLIEATDSTGLSTRARHVVTLSPVSATRENCSPCSALRIRMAFTGSSRATASRRISSRTSCAQRSPWLAA